MRILTYLPALEASGGAQLSVLQLIRELSRRGHAVDLRYEHDGDLSEEFGSFCESLIRGPSIRYRDFPVRDIARILRAASADARTRPDVVYCNNFGELGWGAAIKGIRRARVVCHLREFAPFRHLSLATLGRAVSKFIVASEFSRNLWADHGLARDSIEMIPNGIDLSDYPPGDDSERERARQSLDLSPDAYVVLYLGRIIPEKGVDVLLDAWRKLGASPDVARLLIVGTPQGPAPQDGYLRELMTAGPPGCEWLPMCKGVIDVMHASDVLVLPSRWDEPFGRVIIEAMATGRPAVAAAVGGIPEILDGPFARFLFPRGDSTALAAQLERLRGWRGAEPTLGAQCIEHVASRYSLSKTAARMESVLSGRVGN